MFKAPFSFEGRIRRLEYGLSTILGIFLLYFFIFLVTIVTDGNDESIGTAFFIIAIPYLWFCWAQGAKRCHDLGNSGWWQIIPFYGLWLLFADGDAGPNQYGENPKGIQSKTFKNYPTSYPSNPTTSYTPPPTTAYQGGYNGGHNNPNNLTTPSIDSNAPKSVQHNDTSNDGGYQSGSLYN